MTGNTHWALGVAAGVGVAGYMGVQEDLVRTSLTIGAATVAALLPDIDSKSSMLNRMLFQMIEAKWRSLSLGVINVILALYYFIFDAPLWVLLLGIYVLAVNVAPHRGFTHSLLSMAAITWITQMASSKAYPELGVAVAVGYMTHLLADAVTVRGIPFLWPMKKNFGLNDLGVKVRTGSPVDLWTGRVALIMASGGWIWLLLHGWVRDTVAATFFS